MSKGWPLVKLDDLLTLSDEYVTLVADEDYREVTVRMRGKGVTLRGIVKGMDIATKERRVVRPDQFLLARIDARQGACGIVPADLDGAVVTNDFMPYWVDAARLVPAYLGWMSRTEAFVERLKRASEGTTNRVRIKEHLFLEMEIPLPPLAEQRRLVARIEAVAALVQEAQALRKEAVEEAEALVNSASEQYFVLDDNWEVLPVEDFCDPPQYGYTESASLQPVGPRFLRITDIQGASVTWENVPYCQCPEPSKYLLKTNDLVFARTGATTGKSFVIRECPEAVFASYLIRLRVKDTVLVDYLYRYFQTPSYWKQIADEKTGTGQPNLNGSKLSKLKVPVAPMEEQRRIVRELDALQAQVDALKALQAETQAELDGLMGAVLGEVFGVQHARYGEPGGEVRLAAEP